MLQNILILTAMFAITSCTQDPMATIEGNITEAEGETLYLDHIGIERTTVVDSAHLKTDGAFRFRVSQPECFDFYRLRIGREIAYISIDSTETLRVNAAFPTMSAAYQVDGSDDNLILKRLVHKQSELQHAILTLVRNSGPEIGTTQARIDTLVKQYKESVRMEYIYAAPGKPYAYFALFQRLGGELIFDPLTVRDDIRCFAAVATNLDLYYPESERAKHLKNIAIKGMRNTRQPQTIDYSAIQDKIVEASIIDINLPNIDGIEHRLTDLKGKAVMLDFTAYDHEQSAARVIILRELYNKYAEQGFEIYQVSLDPDEHFWKTAAENIPWICVRDEEAPYSRSATLYGIRELPTYFLINRAGELVMRDTAVKDLEAEIQRLLAE
ncbi:MAG: AhpC/TSA family protein [Bacteroidaceae bacterium]|nr:AhpC/TSA family protein [Bacteroidaceae bacterium]